MRDRLVSPQLFLMLGVVILDQVSKFLVQWWWPEIIRFNENGALSQSFFGFGSWVWPVVTGLVVGGFSVWLVKEKTALSWSLALLVGGGLSNWFDRVFLGGVRDFLVIPGTPLKNNLADYALTLSVVVWVWQLVTQPVPETKKQ